MSHPRSTTASRLLAIGSVLVAAVGVGGELPAQAGLPRGHFMFRSYGIEHGLRNLAAYLLEQDAQGSIWVGTEDGLFRYDGQRFERVGEEQGLPSTEISFLHRARDGALWVGTSQGVAVQEGAGFIALGTDAGVPIGQVWDIGSQDDGTVYVNVRGTLVLGSRTTGFRPLTGLPPPAPEPDASERLLGPDLRKGRVAGVWVAPDGRELLLLRGTWLLRRDADGVWTQEPLPGTERAHALLRDRRGRLWVRGRRVLLRQERPGAPFQDLTAHVPGSGGSFDRLYLDAQDRVWVPTTMGLVTFDGERSWHLGEEEGLPTHWVESLLVDREGSLWVASEGVHRAQGRLTWSVHSRKTGLPADPVWAVHRDREGRLWAGTSRGLAMGGADGWWTVPATAERTIFALAEDGAGGVWAGGDLGTRARGFLLHLPPGASHWVEVPLPSLRPGTQRVPALRWDPVRRVLYVSHMLQGVLQLRLTPAGPQLERLALPGGDLQETVQDILVDRRGHVWMVGNHGLLHFDGERWTRHGKESGLIEENLLSLTEMPDGDVLVSYWDAHALTRFRRTEGRGVPYEGPPELTRDSIYAVRFDARGVLWLGTATGVKRWDGTRLERFGQGNGLRGEDCTANGIFTEPGGDLWVGMSSGLAHFHARAEPPPPAPPPVVLTSVKVGSRPAAGPSATPLSLPHAERTVEFQVAALSFLDEARVALQVRLVGFEDPWRDSPVFLARYTALPPGDYRFEARARLDGGEWGPVAAQAFRVEAPWWHTWWGLGLLGLAAGLVLARLVSWRLGYLRRENERLEALVRARTRELEEASLLDPLTGAKNRRFLQLTLPDEVARVLRRWRSATPGTPPDQADIVFFMVDLDHFKAVNDTYGHAVGDRVLRQVSTVLRSALRETDTLVRWGGEEFLVVAQQTDRNAGESIATKLCDAIRNHEFELGEGQRLRRTCSIGFASFPFLPGAPDALGWEDVVELSDRCLYAAKNSGRDGWVGLTCHKPVAVPEGRLHVSDVLPSMVEARVLGLVSSFPDARKLVLR